MSLDETSPLLPDAQHLLRQVEGRHAPPPIPTIPEEAAHRFGPKLLASLAADSVPGKHEQCPSAIQSQPCTLSSHPLLHPPKLGPNRRHRRHRSPRSRTTLRRRILDDARVRHWRVPLLTFTTSRRVPCCLCLAGWCIALGGGSALDTLGSQAFTGGIHKTDLSIHLQRCVVLLWILFIPVGVLWFFMEPILLAIGEPVRLCKDVQDIMRVLIVAAPGFIAFESLKKYLQCQGKFQAFLKPFPFRHAPIPSDVVQRHHARLDASPDHRLADQPRTEHRPSALHPARHARLPRCPVHRLLARLLPPGPRHLALARAQGQRHLGRIPARCSLQRQELPRISWAGPPGYPYGRYRMVRLRPRAGTAHR